MKKIISLALVSVMTISLVGCSTSSSKEEEAVLELTASMESVMGEFGSTLLAGQCADVQRVTEEGIEELYGITADMYVQVESRIPIDETLFDEYIFIQASEGNIDSINDAFKTRIAYLESSEAGLSEEHAAYVEGAQLYIRGDFAVFAVGMSAEHTVEFFKSKFTDAEEVEAEEAGTEEVETEE